MNNGMDKIEREKRVVERMVRLYYRKYEHNEQLCPECGRLIEYASKRLTYCRFGNHKTSCKRCQVHCYSAEMRERIRCVMRFSGPRMILYEPLEAIKHLLGY